MDIIDALVFTSPGHLVLAFFAAVAGLLFAIGYQVGRRRQADSGLVGPVVLIADERDPDPDIPNPAAEVVPELPLGYLEPSTGPIPLLELLPREEVEAIADELEAVRVERDVLAERLAAVDMLRDRYLRLLRVERARLRMLFGMWQCRRKPALSRLAGERVEVGTLAHPATAPLLPLPMRRALEVAA